MAGLQCDSTPVIAFLEPRFLCLIVLRLNWSKLGMAETTFKFSKARIEADEPAHHVRASLSPGWFQV